ncbi:imidazolonepropionase, partial [Oceanicola sp. S124]|uniref:imidazolonepropionase n=1 Tax=Oceanicola sp. S124 TaxID=1042378 RepID=UPI0002557EB5
MAQRIWTNARIVGVEALVSIAVEGRRIVAVGPDLPTGGAEVTDLGGRLVLPSFIDCHTHLIFGGDRSDEFEARLEGVSYADISRSGGGIRASMRFTRARDEAQLVAEALPRLDALLAEGTSTVEIKSGYGLDIETELRMLRAARRLAGLRPFRLRTTWLAAHALPPEYQDDRQGYIREVAIAGLRAAHAEGLVDAVDAFCEGIAFSPEEIAPLFDVAAELDLPVKLHTEQMTRSGGALLAARHRALSVDHFEYATEEDVAAIAAAGTVAVLLPGRLLHAERAA